MGWTRTQNPKFQLQELSAESSSGSATLRTSSTQVTSNLNRPLECQESRQIFLKENCTSKLDKEKIIPICKSVWLNQKSHRKSHKNSPQILTKSQSIVSDILALKLFQTFKIPSTYFSASLISWYEETAEDIFLENSLLLSRSKGLVVTQPLTLLKHPTLCATILNFLAQTLLPKI